LNYTICYYYQLLPPTYINISIRNKKKELNKKKIKKKEDYLFCQKAKVIWFFEYGEVIGIASEMINRANPLRTLQTKSPITIIGNSH